MPQSDAPTGDTGELARAMDAETERLATEILAMPREQAVQAARTLAIYAREMDRRDGQPERLRALVQGGEVAPGGTSGADQALVATERPAA